MKLQQLVYVTKVAECGSITEAARRLYVSQPSITSAIHDLEQEMNVHIFDRTNKGVVVSEEGETFLGYARQVLEQTELLEDKYKNPAQRVPHFSVSCQHYSFAVNAFVDVIREFRAEPHVFVCSSHPLASRASVTLDDMADYPFLSYEQGSFNSFYYSEELTSTLDRNKNIRVRDRATLFNLLIGLNGYTVCSGVISAELNGASIISVPLDIDEYMEVGLVTRKGTQRSVYGAAYVEAIRRHIPQ